MFLFCLLLTVLACAASSAVASVRVSPRVAIKSGGSEPPRVSGEEVVGGKLATSNGGWSWTPTSYAYQWLLCNSQGRKCGPLSGLTTQAIAVPTAATNRRLRVRVTASGSGKVAAATSNPSGLIAPAPVVEEPAPAPGEETSPPASEEPPPPPVSGGELFREEFNYPDGLVTNEYATWNPGSSAAKTSPLWEMTSGSLLAQSGTGWTGIPDGCSTASANSVPCTASDVFRLNSIRHDFGNVTVSLDLRNNYLTSSSRTPPQNWDGVHVWLHYQSEYNLYYASFNRRDGHIVIKKKCVGGSENGGTYYELGSGESSGYAIPFGNWQHLAAAIQDNADGSVTITMWRNGTKLLSATDSGVGCAPITAAGSVGVRGDNDDFNLDNFLVAQN
jgi:hypothetical protein